MMQFLFGSALRFYRKTKNNNTLIMTKAIETTTFNLRHLKEKNVVQTSNHRVLNNETSNKKNVFDGSTAITIW